MNKHKLLPTYRHKWLLALFCLATYILTGCESNTKYYQYRPVTKDGWLKKDTLFFLLPADLQAGDYEAEIGIRNENAYRYRDIWLTVSQNIEDTLLYKTDTLHFYLADKSGKWCDGNNTGNLHQYVFNSGKTYNIAHGAEKCYFKVTHIMSDNPLKGITDLGIRLVKKQ